MLKNRKRVQKIYTLQNLQKIKYVPTKSKMFKYDESNIFG